VQSSGCVGTVRSGLLYEFLLPRIGPVEARAELVRYLSGELSERVLELSREQIALDATNEES
jgi:hypothetical protein